MKEVLDSKGRETYIEHSDGTWVKSEYIDGENICDENTTHSDGFWSKTRTTYHTNGKVKRFELNSSEMEESNETTWWWEVDFNAEGEEAVYRNSRGRIDEMVYDSNGTLVDIKTISE
jgi:hypothetical protein